MDYAEFGAKVVKILDDITTKPSKQSNLKRENANINGESPMGAMLQYGANTAKEYYLDTMIDPAITRLLIPP